MIQIYNLYNEKNIDAINNELDNIIEKVNVIKANNYEPTIKECFSIKKDIINFVKSNKRIIYGGTAWDELIKNKDSNDKIYNDNECNDVEFYSPKPVDDIVKLCKILNNKYKFVRAQEAQHPETYTIFVNFKAMCDITYMPSPIFYNIKKQTIKGIEYIHPSVILIDILRQYNDPINSYWRLKDKKVFFRANKILKHYPLQLENEKIKNNKNINKEIVEYVFLNIKNINSLVFLIPSFYLNPNSDKIRFDDYFIVFTDNFINDSKLIYSIVLKYFSEKNILDNVDTLLKIDQYVPFYQYWDQRIIFKYNDIPFLIIQGHNQICIPYHEVHVNKNKIEKIIFGNLKNSNKEKFNLIKLGTFIMVLNYYIVNYHYNYIYNKENCKSIDIIIYNLLETRNKYLENNKLTVIDKSPFQEFIIECYGKTIDMNRQKMIRINKKREKGMKFQFTYDPNNDNDNVKDINYQNTSGYLNNKSIKWLTE
jgi:hypothetical protein